MFRKIDAKVVIFMACLAGAYALIKSITLATIISLVLAIRTKV